MSPKFEGPRRGTCVYALKDQIERLPMVMRYSWYYLSIDIV